jgi:hypothetical protein
MNPELKKYLSDLNCKIINPVLERLGSSKEIGWYLKSTSNLRKDHHLELIQSFIEDNFLEYYLVDGSNTEFFIYKN